MNYKYIILDFGKVIAMPSTGNWDITPKLLELIDINKIDYDSFLQARKKYSEILSEKITTLEEEYDMFLRFYDGILGDINYPNHREIAQKIAYNRTYEFNKYKLCENIKEELELLSKKYILLLLTDNWPCVLDYLKQYDLDKYFDKIYVSSIYGVEKKDGLFFDYLIKDYNIKDGEALFIDDTEINLEIAKEKGLDVMLMDRENKIVDSKYLIIHDLYLSFNKYKK